MEALSDPVPPASITCPPLPAERLLKRASIPLNFSGCVSVLPYQKVNSNSWPMPMMWAVASFIRSLRGLRDISTSFASVSDQSSIMPVVS